MVYQGKFGFAFVIACGVDTLELEYVNVFTKILFKSQRIQ